MWKFDVWASVDREGFGRVRSDPLFWRWPPLSCCSCLLLFLCFDLLYIYSVEMWCRDDKRRDCWGWFGATCWGESILQLPRVGWRLLPAQAHRRERKRSIPRFCYCCCWPVSLLKEWLLLERLTSKRKWFVNFHRWNVSFFASNKKWSLVVTGRSMVKERGHTDYCGKYAVVVSTAVHMFTRAVLHQWLCNGSKDCLRQHFSWRKTTFTKTVSFVVARFLLESHISDVIEPSVAEKQGHLSCFVDFLQQQHLETAENFASVANNQGHLQIILHGQSRPTSHCCMFCHVCAF